MQVVVLAGGLAERMRPLTDQMPKSLLPVAGRPFLDRQLALLARGGASRVLLCVGHMGARIRDHLATSKPPVPVACCDDGEAPAGTAGALREAARQGLLEPTFLVTYGDSYLPIDLRPLLETHRRLRLPATLAVLRNENRWDDSNCVVVQGRVVRYEKIADPAARPAEMCYIDYGVSVIEGAEVTGWHDALPFGLEKPLGRLAAAGRLGAHEVTERFYEIGSRRGLEELEAHLQEQA